jgi:dTDP-4-amino-4,6-dideoxygalactose transaminase
MYDKLYNLKNFGIRGQELVVSVGANAKMNEFAAIMGLLNLKNVDVAINDRKRVFEKYKDLLDGVKGIRIFTQLDTLNSLDRNYAYFPILVEADYRISRDELFDKLGENGVCARKYFYPITSDQACFKNMYRRCELQTSRELSNRVLSLPIYEGLDEEIILKISNIIKNYA